MAKVTGGGETTTVIDSGSNEPAAQDLADVITAGLGGGQLTRTTDGRNPPTGYGVLTVTRFTPTVS